MVTTFGPPRGPHAPSPGGECELVEYTTDGKVGGDACVVSSAALKKQPDGAVAEKAAESVFFALAATELFRIQADNAVAPGLLVAVRTVPDKLEKHRLDLLRVSHVADDKALLDTTGFTAAVTPPAP